MQTIAFLGKHKWQILAGTQALCLLLPKLAEKFGKCHCKHPVSEEDDSQNLAQLPQLSPSHSTYYQASLYEQQGAKLAKVSQASFPLFRICITGGSFSGIRTAIEHLNEKLPEQGIKVFMIPNIRQIAKESGATFNNLSKSEQVEQLSCQIKLQLKLEDYFARLAKLAGKPAVILCHNGVLDYKVDFDDDVWQTTLNEQGWNTVLLRDKRYDAILHLVTSANGAESDFFAENKNATQEDLKREIELDERMQKSWNGHPHEIIIPNIGKGLQAKIDEVYTYVQQFVGLPVTSKIFKKFVIENNVKFPTEIDANIFEVEEVLNIFSQQYIQKDFFKHYRKRGQNKFFSYSQAIRIQKENGDFHETKKNITAHEFMILYQERNQNLIPVKKRRICFVWEKQSYIIDEIIRPKGNVSLLRVETLDKKAEIKIPMFIAVQSEVTGVKEYDTAYFAQKDQK